MSFSSEFVSVSVRSTNDSGWIYFADWILAFMVALAFLFYFNRLVGFILTTIFRIMLWKKYKVDFSVESLRISMLGGRLFAKNLVAISADYTISIQSLQFTWRYWILGLTRQNTYTIQSHKDSSLSEKNEHLPSRITMDIEGFEVFYYNRTFAYTVIEDFLNEERMKMASSNNKKDVEKDLKNKATIKKSAVKGGDSTKLDSISSQDDINFVESKDGTCFHEEEDNSANSSNFGIAYLSKLLPISIRIKIGCIIMGNVTTPSVLVASFNSADALYDFGRPKSKLDKYRSIYNLQCNDLKVSMKPNVSFDKSKVPVTSYNVNISEKPRSTTLANLKKRSKHKNWYRFCNSVDVLTEKLLKRFNIEKKKTVNMDEAYKNWKGLSRYVGLTPNQEVFGNIGITLDEYARVSTILDSPVTKIHYYYDIPGEVPHSKNPFNHQHSLKHSPGYGVDIELSNATIHYGPWCDKQRVPLQNLFFPSLNRDADPTPKPKPGELRQYYGFNIFIEVKEELRFRIPTREPSKEAKLEDHHKRYESSEMDDEQDKLPTSRPFGWLELKMKSNSSVSVIAPFIATVEDGWANYLEAHFIKPELRTSVNHDILLTAESHSMKCKLGIPLEWNGKCNWIFDNFSEGAEVFFLREHTMIVSDLLTDFASGGPTPYEYYRPFHYQLNWNIDKYKLFLNVNNANIIDNPLDFNKNKFISFQGSDLSCEVSIPMNGEFSKSSTLSYKMFTSYFDLILDTPPWHTTNAFMEQTKHMGKAHNFIIDGTYTVFSSIEINTSDHIVINCIGDYVTLVSYGFVVKYLLTIRENYFGEYTHFRTFEEYSAAKNLNDDEYSTNTTISEEQEVEYWKIPKVENDVDVTFTFCVRQGLLVIPTYLYDHSDHIGLKFDSLDVDIRFTNYYMELQADLSPITTSLTQNANKEHLFDIPTYVENYMNRSDLIIDGLSIHGHRMFGLPPTEPTFYCKWDIATGDIDIDSSSNFLHTLIASIEKIGFGYKDAENDLAIEEPIIYDITHLSVKVPKICIILRPDTALDNFTAVKIEIISFLFTFNDVANARYTSKSSVIIPKMSIFVINNDNLINTCFTTSINFDNICQKMNFYEHRKLQQEHLRKHDAPFRRCPFFLFPEERTEDYYDGYGCLISALSLPHVPCPLNKYSNMDMDLSSAYDNSASSFDTSVGSTLSSFMDGGFTKMKPSTDYDDEDYIPKYNVDPKYEYDNFIIELGDINGFFSPKSLVIISELLNSFQDTNLASLMDELQLNVLNKLKSSLNSQSNVKNISLALQECNIKLGDFETSDPIDLLESSTKVPCASFTARDLVLEASIKNTSRGAMNNSVTTEEISLAAHLKEVLFSVTNPSVFVPAISLEIKNAEVWYTMSEDKAQKFSNGVEVFTVSISGKQMFWLAELIDEFCQNLMPAMPNFKRFIEFKKKSIPEMVYQISIGCKKYHIDQDPTVLTKLAYVLRSGNDHIRFHDSWKLVSKVRHVLNNLPAKCKSKISNSISNCQWESRTSAYDQVVNLFSQWRTWEVGNVERSFFFKYIFPDIETDDLEDHLDFDIRSNIGLITIKILEGSEADFIEFEDVNFIVGGFNQTKEDYQYINCGIVDVVKKFEILFTIHKYKSKISTLTFSLAPQIQEILSSFKTLDNVLVSETKPKVNSQKPNYEINVEFGFNACKQHIILPFSSIELSSEHFILSSKLIIFPELDNFPCIISSKCTQYSLEVWGEEKIFSNSISQVDMLLSNFGSLEQGVKVLNIKIGSYMIHLTENEHSLIESIQSIIDKDIKFFNELYDLIKMNADNSENNEITRVDSISQEEENKSNAIFEKIGKLSIEFSLNHLSWSLGLFHPLSFSGNIFESKFALVFFEDNVIDLHSSIQKLFFQVGILKSTIIKFENSDAAFDVKFKDSVNSYFANITTNFGFTKITIPQLYEAMEQVLSQMDSLERRINTLKELKLPTKQSDNVSSAKSNKSTTQMKNFNFKYSLVNEYIGISTFFNQTKLSFELESFSCGIYNVATTAEESLVTSVPVFGEVNIPSAKVIIIDKSIPFSLSTILDVNVTLRLLNETDSDQQSFQLESQFCRVCGSIPVLITVTNILDKVIDNWSKFAKSLPLDSSTPEPNTDNSISKTGNFEYIKHISTFTILSYNFCVGWIFSEGDNSYPGIILGSERFFAVIEENVGKFTLMEAYLSVAHGQRTSDYYSTSSEKNNLNRAYLPRMQVIYLIEKKNSKKNLKLQLSGDELDVKFLSDSMAVVENTVKSSSKVQNFFNKRISPKSLSPVTTPKSQKNTGSDDTKLQSMFSSIELLFHFAGSNILLYRINDDSSTTTPSLFLHSPAVNVATMYTHNKQGPDKKHVVKCEISSTASDNTLHAYCVPVLHDIAEGVREMMRSQKPQTTGNQDIYYSPQMKSSSEDSFGQLLKDIDLHFAVRIAKQKLSLSCEPTAKVEAVCQLGGIIFQLDSTDDSSLICSLEVLKSSASLQHVYSREISGFVEVDSILVTTKLDLGEQKSIYSGGHIKKLNCFINMKQFQDVNLFKDIWLPKDLFDDEISDLIDKQEEKKEKEKLKEAPPTKNLSARFKEVSTTYAVPWDLTYMILDFKLEVDFGQSLGTFSLQTNKIWGISSKTTDWAQDLKVGIDQINLISAGRLSGSMNIKDIFLHASISWSAGGVILDVPLILLSGSVDSFKTKAAFDDHVFAIASLEKLSIDIFNQKNDEGISKDHLSIITNLECSEIYITSLAASNALDIFNAIDRMLQENRTTYRETLRESARQKNAIGVSTKNETSQRAHSKSITSSMSSKTNDLKIEEETGNSNSIIRRLISKIEVNAGNFVIYIYPSSFEDSKALIVRLNKSKINFEDSEFSDGIKSTLNIEFNGLKLSLSVTAPSSENYVNESSVNDFVEQAHKAHGGTIFVFPSFQIAMKTFQKYNSNLIEYFYESSFGGTVGIRWNLGSINFIREMYSIHKRALETRIGYSNITKENTAKADKTLDFDNDKVGEDLDETINATIDKVSHDSKYIYRALATPKIQAPQLKELGNATPPLEWFGLHREKFPNVTHQLAIVSLQKFIEEIEQQYTKVLGRA